MNKKCALTGPGCQARAIREESSSYDTGDGMETKTNLTSEPIWQQIKNYYESTGKNLVIKDLFANDPQRFEKFR